MWNDQRVETLKRMWADGLSASQIATELGGITRNAVIGKIHRLGLSGREKTSSTASPRPPKTRVKRIHPFLKRVARPAISEDTKTHPAFEYVGGAEEKPVMEIVPAGGGRTMEELSPLNCRWPYGDPGEEGFFYCGHDSLGGHPYCLGHCSVAYRPATRRERVQHR